MRHFARGQTRTDESKVLAAITLAGDASCHVLWAIESDGDAQVTAEQVVLRVATASSANQFRRGLVQSGRFKLPASSSSTASSSETQ
jgi:hypothetical protein